MDKKSLSARDICNKYIAPAVQQAGWDMHKQVREEVSFTKGRIIVRGKLHSRGGSRRADFILYHQANLPIAVFLAGRNILADQTKNNDFKPFGQVVTKQTTNLASINMTQLRACASPIPPLAEQYRIVAKVDQLMALCDQLKARLFQARQFNKQLASALVGQAVA